ncbi:MAG: hypothetical protein JW861_09300 [Bacteroidales bacterium]|nr:hypothetical protein [Bacteroidales bacterium]
MREVVILIPDIEPEQNIEIDVRINGRNRTLQYRVELLRWEGGTAAMDDRITTLKHRIKEYEKDWELVEIGAPKGEDIPLMFRRKTE